MNETALYNAAKAACRACYSGIDLDNEPYDTKRSWIAVTKAAIDSWEASKQGDDVHDDLVVALRVLLDEATSFNVGGVYFSEPCMGHRGIALAENALAKAALRTALPPLTSTMRGND